MSVKNELEKIEMLREAFKSYLFEAGDELAGGGVPMPAAPAPQAPQQQQQVPPPEQTMDPMGQNQQPATPEYTIQQFVASLNKIRGGRSFDDQDVFQQINTVFASLDPVSKETLRTVVGQLESIVTPQQAPEQPAADGSLPSVQDTQAYNTNVNAAPGSPTAPPASFGAQAEAPPA